MLIFDGLVFGKNNWPGQDKNLKTLHSKKNKLDKYILEKRHELTYVSGWSGWQ